MTLNNEKNLTEKLISLGCLATLLVVTPWSTIDPINVPKFALLVLTASVSVALLMKNFRILFVKKYLTLEVISITFLVFLLLSFSLSKMDVKTQLFGVNGRNTGLLTYISLLILMLVTATMTKKGFEKRLIKTLIVGGSFSVVYGFIQHFGLDPVGWVNPYSPVIGFLGNPDFQSSFLGLCAASVVALMFSRNLNIFIRIALLSYVLISLFVISSSDAQQGFLVFIAACGVVFAYALYKSTFKKFTSIYLAFGLVSVIAIVLGSLNKGILASLLHKESVIYRGDYWRAGWKITLEHPFLGVGLDGYGDWYRRARTLAATLRRGPDVTSNAAHNVLLDLSSNGGFPLLGAYLALIIFTLICIARVIKSSKQFDPYFAALLGGWVAYHAQSIISLNQIGLAIWGWVLTGAIIGYSYYQDDEIAKIAKFKGKTTTASSMALAKISPSGSIAVFLGLAIGVLAGAPPYLASAKYRSAMESGNPATITQAAYIWPIEISRLGQVAATLRDNKMESQALPIILDATRKFPDSYEAWKILASLPNASADHIATAKAQMKRLDPHNPELK